MNAIESSRSLGARPLRRLIVGALLAALAPLTGAAAQTLDDALNLPPRPVIEVRPPPASAQKLSPGVADGPPLNFVLPNPAGAPDAPSAPTLGVSSSTGGGYAMAEDRGPKAGPWYADITYGVLSDAQLVNFMFNTSNTTMTGDQQIGFSIGREVWDIGSGFSVEAGVMVNGRIDEDGVEFAAPVAIVFDDFPWRRRLPTRLRLATGPSFTSEISDAERKRDGGDGSKFLLLFNPEIEVGLPSAPEVSAFLRLHHRTGLGLIKGVNDGSTYLTTGLRYRFAVPELDPLD